MGLRDPPEITMSPTMAMTTVIMMTGISIRSNDTGSGLIASGTFLVSVTLVVAVAPARVPQS
ncbi:hypothetical protein NY051_07805 [Corynebacterium diphtheriae bv. gravis]|nr:hypothetical protein NY051_07805 [Corynebacterium diphtheriae bv. gravis]